MFSPPLLQCNINVKGQKSLVCFSKFNLVCGQERKTLVLPSNNLLCRPSVLFSSLTILKNYKHWGYVSAVRIRRNIWTQEVKIHIQIHIVHSRWLTSFSLLSFSVFVRRLAQRLHKFFPPQHKYWLRNPNLNHPTYCILGCAVSIV